MTAWEEFHDLTFADVAGNIRAALDGGREDELKAKRRAGLAAYTRAMEARGTPRRRAHIIAAASPVFADLGDD